jgi:hypothetical protein
MFAAQATTFCRCARRGSLVFKLWIVYCSCHPAIVGSPISKVQTRMTFSSNESMLDRRGCNWIWKTSLHLIFNYFYVWKIIILLRCCHGHWLINYLSCVSRYCICAKNTLFFLIIMKKGAWYMYHITTEGQNRSLPPKLLFRGSGVAV